MRKKVLVMLMVAAMPILSGCEAVSSTLDCVDLWRIQNCPLIDGNFDAGY